MKKQPSTIIIESDGENVRIRATGEKRDIANAMETAAFLSADVRAAIIYAAVQMFRLKEPELAKAILQKWDYNPITEQGRKEQERTINQLLQAA